MSIKTQIDQDLKQALLNGDKAKLTLRSLKAAILNQEIASKKREEGLSDSEIEKVVASEIKKRKESAEMYAQNNRPEQAESELAEAKILAKYLPEQLTEVEINKIIDDILTDGDFDLKQMGQVIGLIKKQVGNQAEGSLIAKLVQQKLK